MHRFGLIIISEWAILRGRPPARSSMATPEIRILHSLEPIPASSWNALGGDDPFLRHEFLAALHETGCASQSTGWLPRFITLWEGSALCGAMPLYLKSHSYGEYVFDWAWASAYQRHGYSYYPKLLSAVPFSPVTGQRLLAPTAPQRALLVSAALELAREENLKAIGSPVSSFHCLYPHERDAREMEDAGMMLRQGIQFHWKNRGYASFDDFLAEMSHAKRKKIRQERRKVQAAGIRFEWLSGRDARMEHWRFFIECYNRTYDEHRSMPYLNLEFFIRLGSTMPDNVLLVLALRDGRPIAAALNLHNAHTLYGRYWGSTEFIPGLHFETCYYQAIEFCIAHGIGVFEGGAQGEHKLARGFLPVRTWSAHWLAHAEFAAAIGTHVAREAEEIGRYFDQLNDSSPFRAEAEK